MDEFHCISKGIVKCLNFSNANDGTTKICLAYKLSLGNRFVFSYMYMFIHVHMIVVS